jgi:hypothetical protein
MVFAANNTSNELLHAVSDDGINNWGRRNNLRGSTRQAPTLASVNGRLVCIFIANNDTNTILKSTWVDEGNDVWDQAVSLDGRSPDAPALDPNGVLKVYITADNPSNDILVGTA